MALAADAIAQAGQGTIASGRFTPDWNSLSADQAPDWFRNAKFGIWAHWGPGTPSSPQAISLFGE